MKGKDLRTGMRVKDKEIASTAQLVGGSVFIEYDDGTTAVVGHDQEVAAR